MIQSLTQIETARLHRIMQQQRIRTKDDFVKARFVFRLIFLMAFTGVLSLFYIGSRARVVQFGYEIDRLISQQKVLLEENRKLDLELTTLNSPERLSKIAGESLKMSLPKMEQIRVIE